uniref:Uncharacterized protein n=1 Tax=Candidatus Methanogaster sp. ANME-2c ERB4 TaxID=2759911 RepID=A0A7G9YDC1_9EURY|nr:hypothetical protein BDIOFFAC_00014 [Methanosarcinales archaeon ANME-2c ERB4]
MLAVPVSAINFNTPESTVAEIMADPEYYDGTITIGTIAIIGTLTNISCDVHISEGGQCIAVDTRDRSMFEGFEEGDTVKMIGIFYYKRVRGSVFDPECVIHWPITDSKTVAIPELMENPQAYNGRKITVIGNLTDVRESGMGYRMDVEDGGQYLDIKFYGRTLLEAGTAVKATGIFVGGTMHADTVAKRETLPFGIAIPGFSGLLAAGMLAFALVVASRTIKKR